MSSERGLGAVALIIVLLVAGLCYLGYAGMRSAMEKQTAAVTTLDGTRGFACLTNRQTLEREIQMWSVNHAGESVSLAALASGGAHVASCPQGGAYTLDGPHVRCSKHP